MFYKPEIREKLLQRRQQLTPVNLVQAAQAVAAQMVQDAHFLNSQHIGCYLTDGHELDTLPLMHCATSLHKQLYLPVLDYQQLDYTQAHLTFVPYHFDDPLVHNRFGIREPAHIADTKPATELDLIILPLVGFDAVGNRLGRGAGYYDRTLHFIQSLAPGAKRPYLLGVAYEFQQVPLMQPDSWDVPLDKVITDSQVYYCRNDTSL